jgi:transcriptional regulator with XRE-family HTH domain
LAAGPGEVKASRLTPDRIRRLRNKLGLSMRELGILTGSSIGAVQSWEKGKFRPKGEKKAALVALRKLKKREVKEILAQRQESKVQAEKGAEGKERKRKATVKVVRKKIKK